MILLVYQPLNPPRSRALVSLLHTVYGFSCKPNKAPDFGGFNGWYNDNTIFLVDSTNLTKFRKSSKFDLYRRYKLHQAGVMLKVGLPTFWIVNPVQQFIKVLSSKSATNLLKKLAKKKWLKMVKNWIKNLLKIA